MSWKFICPRLQKSINNPFLCSKAGITNHPIQLLQIHQLLQKLSFLATIYTWLKKLRHQVTRIYSQINNVCWSQIFAISEKYWNLLLADWNKTIRNLVYFEYYYYNLFLVVSTFYFIYFMHALHYFPQLNRRNAGFNLRSRLST